MSDVLKFFRKEIRVESGSVIYYCEKCPMSYTHKNVTKMRKHVETKCPGRNRTSISVFSQPSTSRSGSVTPSASSTESAENVETDTSDTENGDNADVSSVTSTSCKRVKLSDCSLYSNSIEKGQKTMLQYLDRTTKDEQVSI